MSTLAQPAGGLEFLSTGVSSNCTFTGSSGRRRRPRTCSKRRCSPRGGALSSSTDARRSAPGS